ncbi:hypothetical protein [Petrachloros mirabilis]
MTAKNVAPAAQQDKKEVTHDENEVLRRMLSTPHRDLPKPPSKSAKPGERAKQK